MNATPGITARLVRAPGSQDVTCRGGVARTRPGAPGGVVPAAGDAGTARKAGAPPAGDRRFTAVLPPETAARVPAEAKAAVLASADRLLRGEWEVLGVVRTDMVRPDWFRDPVTGRRSDPGRYAFRVDHRSEARSATSSRSGRSPACSISRCWPPPGSFPERRSTRTGWPSHLRSWWQENPFLSGVHWTSGIELGVRLISLAWIRRLLDDWPGVADLFERDATRPAADPLASAVSRRVSQPRLIG